jgi:hypothetical protein
VFITYRQVAIRPTGAGATVAAAEVRVGAITGFVAIRALRAAVGKTCPFTLARYSFGGVTRMDDIMAS